MYKAYARHRSSKGQPDAWFAIYAGFDELGEQHAIDKGYSKLLSWRDDLDLVTIRERYEIHVLQVDCKTDVYDPRLKMPIRCGVFGIFCPECEFKLEASDERE